MFTALIEQVVALTALVVGPMVATKLGVPQGIDFESTLVFEVVTVVGALVALALTTVGAVCAFRAEKEDRS